MYTALVLPGWLRKGPARGSRKQAGNGLASLICDLNQLYLVEYQFFGYACELLHGAHHLDAATERLIERHVTATK